MNIAIRSFKGIAPKIEPRYLPEGAAQVAVNVVAEGQSVRPMRDAEATGHSVIFDPLIPGVVPTIYKAGVDETSDTNYWLSSNGDISVARNQIAGDTCEWTFFAAKDAPTQVTNKNGWEGKTGKLPALEERYRLGIPAPDKPLTGWVTNVAPDTTQAALTITASDLTQFVTWNPYTSHPNGFHVSIDKGANWFYPVTLGGMGVEASVSLLAVDLEKLDPQFALVLSIDGDKHSHTAKSPSNTATDVAAALAAVQVGGRPLVTTSVVGGNVVVSSQVSGASAALTIAWIELQPSGARRVATGLGTALTPSEVMNALLGTVLNAANPIYPRNASDFLSGALTTSGGVATGFTLTVKENCRVDGLVDPDSTTEAACRIANGVWASGENSTVSVKWGDNYSEAKTATGTTEDKGTYESRIYVFTWTYVTPCGSWTWESAPSPPSEVANVYADSTVYVLRAGVCSISGYSTPETCEAAGGSWDAGRCSKAGFRSETSCVAAGGVWTPADELGGTYYPDPGYPANGIRLYRSVAGQYLLVAYGSSDSIEYTDSKKADELGEPCPSITWSPPPSREVNGATQYLDGILNLPNGMAAGFLGRDVYFCEPYRPFAWPENYIQTLDDPIIGLGRMDTTLAVLTAGNPYFIQGSEPSNMIVVKADLEQSCVSKRSIVSMGRSVFYASPDGLVMLTPGGSAVVTEALFDRTYWQRLQPATIHAYGHDNKYVAFFGRTAIALIGPNGATYQIGGFVLDTASKQFYLHGFTASAGYHDLRTDTLYLATATAPYNIVKWGQGAPVASGSAVWRSKVFSMPQGTGFSCGQLEAAPLTLERDGAARAAYPLTLRVYADGALFWQQVVTSQAHYDAVSKLLMGQRAPFRLPPLVNANGQFLGRDWGIELDVDSEIFNVALAQAMSEIASV